MAALDMSRKAKNARKQKRQARRALYDPSQLLSGGALRGAARLATDYEYKPQISAAKQNIAGLGALGKRTGERVDAIYHQLAADVQHSMDQQQAINQRLGDTTKGIYDDAAGTLNRNTEQAAQTLGQYGGIAAGGRQALGDTLESQSKTLQADTQAGRERAANQTHATDTFGNQMAATAQMTGAQSKTDIARMIANRTAGAQGELSTLRSQRGGAYLKNLMDLRSGERDFGIAQSTLNANIANDQAKIDIEGQKLAQGQEKIDLDARRLESDLLTAKTVRAKNRAKKNIDIYNLNHPHHPIAGGTKGGAHHTATPGNMRDNNTKFETYKAATDTYGGDYQVASGSDPTLKDPTLYAIAYRVKHHKATKHDLAVLHAKYPGALRDWGKKYK